jgi:hypothetical protein
VLRKKPGTAPPIGGDPLSRDRRQRVSAEERRLPSGLSLRADFGGHTIRRLRQVPFEPDLALLPIRHHGREDRRRPVAFRLERRDRAYRKFFRL